MLSKLTFWFVFFVSQKRESRTLDVWNYKNRTPPLESGTTAHKESSRGVLTPSAGGGMKEARDSHCIVWGRQKPPTKESERMFRDRPTDRPASSKSERAHYVDSERSREEGRGYAMDDREVLSKFINNN